MNNPPIPAEIGLTVVIPARNEEARLPATLARIAEYASDCGSPVEVLVVDDGSVDRTLQVTLEAPAPLRARGIRLDRSSGPGAAVKRGVLEAAGARILICDADGPVPFEDLNALHAALDQGAGIAAGSRALRPHSVLRSQPPHRVLMGKVWRRLVLVLAPTGVLDTQCGFKLLERRAARHLFERLSEPGFVFHVELLLLARRHCVPVVEVPVRWSDGPGSKIRLLSDSTEMLMALLRVAWRHSRRSPLKNEELSHAS